ncbi:MAG TPA: hypothetical protein VM686_03040 [Polyangiaceae bacterium]|nr:hypothetical protein [Polyangiaceae bacterium]
MTKHRVVVVAALVALLGIVAVLLVYGGRSSRAPRAAASSDKPLVLPPLSAEQEIVSLAVPGSDGARVSVPIGAEQPRPIVIVLHAEAERADQQCKIWREITTARPFVLCPQLAAKASHAEVEKQLRGALRELKQTFGDYVAKGSVVLVGFGSGAEHAVEIARQEPSFFARLVLVDAGHEGWSATSAGAYKQRGGQRLLFVCSSDRCRAALEPRLPIIRSQNLAVELLHAGDLPGALDPRMVARLKERFSWLTSNEQPKRVPNPRGVVPE